MAKKLSDMTLEELWQLFPILLTPHQACWKDWYQEEETLLKTALPDGVKFHHIGSTSLTEIWAKPIVDILVEVPAGVPLTAYQEAIGRCGYLCMSAEKDRMSFNKGYTEQGFAERVFHLHLRYAGDCDELYFRDYLKENPDIAKAYEGLKLGLWKEYEHDRDGYTNAKTEFIQKYTNQAKEKYFNRYE